MKIRTGRILRLNPMGLSEIKSLEERRNNKMKRYEAFPETYLKESQRIIDYAHFVNTFSGEYEIHQGSEDNGFKPYLKPSTTHEKNAINGQLIFPASFGGEGSFYTANSADWDVTSFRGLTLFCNLQLYI